MNLTQGGEARYANGLWVSGSFFDVLGVRPILGRLLSPADDRRGCGSSGIVASYSFWQHEFGGQSSALGKTITLEGHPFEIVGVTPASFFGVEVGRNFDVALSICAEPVIDGEDERMSSFQAWWLAVIGRLKPGVSLKEASNQLAAISPGIFAATLPPKYDSTDKSNYLNFKLGSVPAAAGVSSLRREYETPLLLLMWICGIVLLIACANLSNLIIARASARSARDGGTPRLGRLAHPPGPPVIDGESADRDAGCFVRYGARADSGSNSGCLPQHSRNPCLSRLEARLARIGVHSRTGASHLSAVRIDPGVTVSPRRTHRSDESQWERTHYRA